MPCQLRPRLSSSTALVLCLLTATLADVMADSRGIKARVTDAVCSNGMTLSDYSVECVNDEGDAADCALGRSANINANGELRLF